MTRENKLVMVIGFGLLLFVGILVSDHLSARGSQIGSPETLVSYETTKPLPGHQDDLAEVRHFGDDPLRGPDGPATIGGVQLVQPVPAREEFQHPIYTPPAAPIVAAERTHTVVKGDNPEKIAAKYYNKKSLATKLVKYNGIEPTKLKVGQTIKVPDITVLDPSAVPQVIDTPAQSLAVIAPAPAPTPAPAPASAVAKYKTVTVKKGDTLWSIAARSLGNGSKSKQIIALNPGLTAESKLKLGSSIKVALAN
ncbi:MAG: LysM domain [Planctomycetota bacterium]|jgi:LysM repeat protein